MFVCPQCGYRLPQCWHSYRWVTDLIYCRFEDFQREYPRWKALELGEIIEDEHNYYRRSSERNGGVYVQCWSKTLGKDYYKTRFFERFKVPRDFGLRSGQKQLELNQNE